MTPGRLLDAWRNPETDVRIAVERWCTQEPVTLQFVEQPATALRVWHYLRRIGPVDVWRKIRSRLAERVRNRKVAGLGIGRVLEVPEGSPMQAGQRVAFFAPNHSPGWPRLSLDARLIRPLEGEQTTSSGSAARPTPESLRASVGWSPYSGSPLDTESVEKALKLVAGPRSETIPEACQPDSAHLANGERSEATAGPATGQTAVLFGLGNYAKTLIIPNVRQHLHLTAIHEIDPDQLATARGLGAALDTSPWPRDGQRYDAWFIAGYHHSHAALAVRALETGAYAVVEKPLVTTREQLETLTQTLTAGEQKRLFTCFNRRYARWNEWARTDLGAAIGDPIDMHCLVYEIPLPALHWYNWPNSGSRLISNGTHWLDYFHYLNDFSPATKFSVRPLRGTDFTAWVQLDNGAQLTMSLTETGSERLGVRDVIELRARHVTVRMIDSADYHAESTTRVLGRRRVNPLHSFRRMYDTICRTIVACDAGDSLESLRSTALMLDLEAELRDQRRS